MAGLKTGRYPYISESAWWTLRKKFIQSMPATVTASYLASLLSTTEESARGNTLAPLKQIGLVDETGKPTDLAFRWRDDSQYAAVCNEIIDKIYPQELRDLYPDADVGINPVKSWFQNKVRVGENAASKYSRFYLLLLSADPTKESKTAGVARTTRVPTSKDSKDHARPKVPAKTSQPATSQRGNAGTTSANVATDEQLVTDMGAAPTPEHGKPAASGLSLHIDLQIHISPEASPEQIDKVFESMAKHLQMNK